MKRVRQLLCGASTVTVACCGLVTATAHAAGGAGFQLFGGDFSYNGFIRMEDAFNTSRLSQQANQFGDLSNGVAIPRQAGNPFTGYTTTLAPGDLPPALAGISALPPTPGVTNLNAVGTADTFSRYIPKETPILNYHILRLESSARLAWGTNWSFQARLRVVGDPGGIGYRDFDIRNYSYINNGLTNSGGDPGGEFQSTPDYFSYAVDGKQNPLFFERSGRNYQIDLPAFFAQWTNGNVTVRVGNQTVAWGQLLFFRVLDTANGLDLRRHLFLGRALEEYADQRESAPGVRVTWQATDQISVDAYAQQFIPTIVPNVNTPYNIVPSQFFLHDDYWQDGDYRKVNYGVRIKAEEGNYNFDFIYTRRYNQLGAIRWRNSNVNKPLPNDNSLGLAFNAACAATLIPAYNLQHGTALATNNGCGPLLANTAFEVAPGGVFTAEEWFNYAGYIRLSGLNGLDKAVDDFPAAQEIFAQDIGRNVVAAGNELDAFFIAADGLHGHIERKYFQENVIGGGAGYVTEGEPGSLFDQLIINLEGTYCPRREYTSIDLGHNFTTENEEQIGVVMEKYQRFFTSIPATYMVFQALHQKNSDLAGLLLSGYGSDNYSANGIKLNPHVPTSTSPDINPGVRGGANYVVLAALQPTDAYIYEFSFATLIDVNGGVLFQPAVQWKPKGNVTVNLFYNYINGHAWGGNENRNIVGILNDDDEFNIRLAYEF